AFFMAVVLHELEAKVVETRADDGAWKVVVPSGAGVRPLLVAEAFVRGEGQGFVDTFDRLAVSQELAHSPASLAPTTGRFPAATRPSTGRFAAVGRPSTGNFAAVGG